MYLFQEMLPLQSWPGVMVHMLRHNMHETVLTGGRRDIYIPMCPYIPICQCISVFIPGNTPVSLCKTVPAGDWRGLTASVIPYSNYKNVIILVKSKSSNVAVNMYRLDSIGQARCSSYKLFVSG